MSQTISQLRKNFVLTGLLLCSVFVKAQTSKGFSSLELDSLLQSKTWFCVAPVGMSNFFDSLNTDRVLLPKYVERSSNFAIKFEQQNFSMEDGLFITCGTESHSFISGLYYLNGDGTLTVQLKWSECRGQLCFDNLQREAVNTPALTYRILVQEDNIIFKLIE